jgi:hypothetical protein
MPRPSPYTDKQKAAIIEVVKATRKAGKKWPEILEAAKADGFKGGLQYLMKFAHKAGAVRRRKRRHAAPAATTKRGPGRPKGRPKTAGNGAGLAGIESIVERMVEQRVRATVGRAVASLEAAAKELKRL